MYCPNCGNTTSADQKFCRSCGTELEAVALALSRKSVPPIKASTNKSAPKTTQDWLEKRIEGVSGITRGAILMTVSLLLGVALALFLPGTFEARWILIWMVFFGWMAVWGGIEMAYGISGVFEAKSKLRLMGLTGEELAVEATPQQLLSSGEPSRHTNPSAGFRSSPPVSVTEGTTRQLDDQVER